MGMSEMDERIYSSSLRAQKWTKEDLRRDGIDIDNMESCDECGGYVEKELNPLFGVVGADDVFRMLCTGCVVDDARRLAKRVRALEDHRDHVLNTAGWQAPCSEHPDAKLACVECSSMFFLQLLKAAERDWAK